MRGFLQVRNGRSVHYLGPHPTGETSVTYHPDLQGRQENVNYRCVQAAEETRLVKIYQPLSPP